MINATINYIRVVDDELFNRIVAFGPGDGINRVSITVEDANSIFNYGLRQKVEAFNDATDRDSLEALALAYLAEHKEPVTEMEVTFYSEAAEPTLESILYEGEAVTYGGEDLAFWRYGSTNEVRRGDTIRIVSQSLKLNTTGVIEEIDWEPGQVTLTINKKHHNLLDVINGPEREDERQENALGLPVPLSFRAQRASPGIRVYVNPYTNSRATGVEVYASTVAAFTPTREYLLARGTATEFLFPELASGSVFYFRARSYDNQGNYSEFTDETAAVSGYVDGGRIEEGSITDLTPFASALTPPRLVLSLPVVPNPDYELGDLVAFDGDLYKLVSEAAVPNEDNWQILADLTELDGRLVANRLVSAQIEAGAIRAEQIDADAVTAGKILVNGPVTVANENTAQDGAFVVLKDVNGIPTETLRLGAGIDGKPGVPSGTDYGLWGALGTGVFIEGAPRVIGTGFVQIFASVASGYSLANGSVVAFISTTGDCPVLVSSITVPTGKKVVLVPTPVRKFSGSDYVSMTDFEVYWNRSGMGTSSGFYELTAGSYTDLRIIVLYTVHNGSGAARTLASGAFYFYWTAIEVDA